VCVVVVGMLRMCRRRPLPATNRRRDDGQRGVEPNFHSSGGESACVVHTTMARGNLTSRSAVIVWSTGRDDGRSHSHTPRSFVTVNVTTKLLDMVPATGLRDTSSTWCIPGTVGRVVCTGRRRHRAFVAPRSSPRRLHRNQVLARDRRVVVVVPTSPGSVVVVVSRPPDRCFVPESRSNERPLR